MKDFFGGLIPKEKKVPASAATVADATLTAPVPIGIPGHPNMPALTVEGINAGIDEYHKRAGRITMLTPDLACEIAARLASGETLLAISKEDKMPAYGTLFRWQSENPGFREAIAQARKSWSHAMAEEAKVLLDGVDGTVRDNQVRKAEAQARIRLELAGKYNFQDFGDKKQQMNLNINADVSPVDLSNYINRQ